MNTAQEDPFDLARFVTAQENTYTQALEELRQGQKKTHWMWFIFPQYDGLGSSATAKHYAIKSVAEAMAYLAHPILGPRLRECCAALLSLHDKTAAAILGYPDDLKLKSSMTLFAHLAPDDAHFIPVLQTYFSGEQDPRTLQLLRVES